MTPASLIRVKGVFPAIGMADAGALPLLSCVQLRQFFLNHGHHFGGNLVLPFTAAPTEYCVMVGIFSVSFWPSSVL